MRLCLFRSFISILILYNQPNLTSDIKIFTHINVDVQ